MQRVLSGQVTYHGGRTWEYEEFADAFPKEDFYAGCGVNVCPADVLVHELDVPRDVRQRLDPPITPEEVTAIQNRVKAAAVALPCIPPLVVGVVVFASRRLRERENISKSRLK